MQAQRCVQPTGTNQTCGLAFSASPGNGRQAFPVALRFSRVSDSPASAGGHRGGEIPVPIPNTEVKPPIAEGSAGPARARVGRRRLFLLTNRRGPAPSCGRSPLATFAPRKLALRARGIRRLFSCPAGIQKTVAALRTQPSSDFRSAKARAARSGHTPAFSFNQPPGAGRPRARPNAPISKPRILDV